MKGQIIYSGLFFFIFNLGLLNAQTKLPDNFIDISSSSQQIKEKYSTAKREFSGQSTGDKFWFGYQFQVRADVQINTVNIEDDGDIQINRGNNSFIFDEDGGLKMQILQALSELGDEEAKAKLEARLKELNWGDRENWGVFFLFSKESDQIKKIKLLNFRRKSQFRDYPVYWAGTPENKDSFSVLSEIILNDHYQKKVIEPAILVLSLHDYPDVVPFLEKVAGGAQYVDVRKSAVFWLGQIPGENSILALERLYKNEHNRKIQEKLIFSISQHESDRSVELLIDIAEDDGHQNNQEKAIFWLGQKAGRKSLQVLGGITESDETTEIKNKAVFAISQHENSKAAAEMLMEIARNNKNPEVRKKAMFWLGQTGDKRALAFFKEILLQ